MSDAIFKLRSLRSLQPLNRTDLKKLARYGREIHYSGGQYVFRENARGDSFFILLAGQVQVTKNIKGKGQVALRTLKPGNIFGEMAAFTLKRRSASCQVLQQAVVLEVPVVSFKKLLNEGDSTAYKLIHLNCHLLADRLNHILDLIGKDSFATSVENPMFLRKVKFFWAV